MFGLARDGGEGALLGRLKSWCGWALWAMSVALLSGCLSNLAQVYNLAHVSKTGLDVVEAAAQERPSSPYAPTAKLAKSASLSPPLSCLWGAPSKMPEDADPSSPVALNNLGVAYAEQGSAETAHALFAKAADLGLYEGKKNVGELCRSTQVKHFLIAKA